MRWFGQKTEQPNALDIDTMEDGWCTRKEITDANGVLIPFASPSCNGNTTDPTLKRHLVQCN
jgi:hypothetical protein